MQICMRTKRIFDSALLIIVPLQVNRTDLVALSSKLFQSTSTYTVHTVQRASYYLMLYHLHSFLFSGFCVNLDLDRHLPSAAQPITIPTIVFVATPRLKAEECPCKASPA